MSPDVLKAIGAGIAIVMVLFLLVATWEERIGIWRSIVLGMMGVITATVVASFDRIGSMIVQAGEHFSVNLTLQEMRDAADQVRFDKEEVERIKQDIATLAAQGKEQKRAVSQMYGSMQQTWRSLFESFAYIASTTNLFPPPSFIRQEIARHINILADFAYPDPEERSKAVQKVMKNVQKAQEGGIDQ